MSASPQDQGGSLVARMSMWSAHHRRWVVLAWLGLIVAAFAACSTYAADTSVQGEAPGEAGEAADLIAERFGAEEDVPTEFLVVSHPTLTVDDPAFEGTVTGLIAALEGLVVEEASSFGGTDVVSDTRVVAATASHYDLVGLPREDSPFVAVREGQGDVTFAIIELEGDTDQAVDDVGRVLDAVAAYEPPAAFADGAGEDAIQIGGEASLTKQLEEIIGEDFNRASVLNLPITFIILILAFGAIIAALAPIILAFAAIFVALGALTVISQFYPLADVYEQVVLLIGLATGIDYALFVITRFRDERRAGLSKDDALRVAMGTSGKAVVFAGSTTVFAVAGMFLVSDSIFSSLGLASIVIVLVAVSSAVTLLPAMMGFLGDNVNRLTIPVLGRQHARGEGAWGFIIDNALKRPIFPAAVTIIALLAISVPSISLLRVPSPYLEFNLGFNGVRSFSDDAEGKAALLTLEENFTLGLAQPAVVVVDAGERRNVFATAIQAAATDLLDRVGERSVAVAPDEFFGVVAQPPEFNDAGDTEVIFVPINADAGEDRAIDAVELLREDLIPQSFEDADARALVTGASAGNVDFRENILFRSPFVVLFVLGLAFLILLLVFRSLVIAVTAIFLNLLSVGFAYGMLVLIFQEGYALENVLNFEATGIIESWLPLFLFSILFGLSIDYEMYVMTRIKELYERGLSTDEAIAQGVKATAGVITNAAAIMVAVALIFAFTRNIGLQQFGFGLACAILIDATVIRALVLPTTMKLLGSWNWYMPSWLEWLPRVPMAE